MECPGCGITWQSNWKECPMCNFSFSDLPRPNSGLRESLQKPSNGQENDIIQNYRNKLTSKKHENSPEVQKSYFIADVFGLFVGICVTILLLAFTLQDIIAHYANYSFYGLIRFLVGLLILSIVLPLVCVRALTLRYYRHKGFRF